jgi:hypothetical protein
MALTGSADDSSSDDFVKVDGPEGRSENIGQDAAGAEPVGLNETKLEEHNKNIGEEIQACSRPGNEANEDAETEAGSTEVGAGVLFGVSGLLLGGPILGLLTGAGAALLASNDEGPVGEAARASGDFAVTTGAKVGEAAKEANEKHGVLDKIKEVFAAGWGKVQQFDEEHKASEKVKETVSGVTEKTVEFERNHHIVENALQGIQNGVNFLLEKLRGARTSTGTESCNENK